MSELVFLTSSAKQTKTKVTDITRKINDASSEITSAKRKLDNVEYVNVSYEIGKLDDFYKDNNKQISEFELFAKQVESMVNDYENVDNSCAKTIKANGKNHRKSTGLHKSLALATISASFDKIGNTLDNIEGSIEQWVDGVVDSIVDGVKGAIDWIINSIKEDWESWLQLAEGVIQIASSFATLGTGIAIAATGAGIPAAIPIIAASLVTMYAGVDKTLSSVVDITNILETDGSTVTKMYFEEKKGYKWFGYVYDIADVVAGLYNGATLSKLANPTQSIELYTLFGKGSFANNMISGIEKINNISKSKYTEAVFDYTKPVVSMGTNLMEGDIEKVVKEIWKTGLKVVGGKLIGDEIENKIDDVAGDLAESAIKNKIPGVLG